MIERGDQARARGCEDIPNVGEALMDLDESGIIRTGPVKPGDILVGKIYRRRELLLGEAAGGYYSERPRR
jgi:DNA-directed RNA polymerase beta subunit